MEEGWKDGVEMEGLRMNEGRMEEGWRKDGGEFKGEGSRRVRE
jgi:hypothetical protein